MGALVPRNRFPTQPAPPAEIVQDSGHNVVPGTNIPVLTFKLLDDGGHPRHVALEQVRQEKQALYPGAFVQVVPADAEDWEYVR